MRVTGFNSYEGYPVIGVRVTSQEFERTFIVCVTKSILVESFWIRFRLVLMVYLIIGGITFYGFNYLRKKDRKHKEDLEANNRMLEGLVDDRTKELKNTNQELSNSNADLNKALKDLNDAQDQLIQAEKMASLGILAAGVGHEINNPLNFIKGGHTALSEILGEDNPKIDKDVKTYLDVIGEGVKRCNVIVESLSNYSRQGGAMKESCDLQSILENCLVILNNRMKSKVAIIKEYDDNNVIVLGNEGKLHQVFMNIITNAEQAIEEKGTISIGCRQEKDFAVVSIKDDGIGIKRKDLKKISDPFYTTKAPGEGTGLGLSIAYSIVKEHKGNIKCNSVVNEGTEFVIKLPIVRN